MAARAAAAAAVISRSVAPIRRPWSSAMRSAADASQDSRRAWTRRPKLRVAGRCPPESTAITWNSIWPASGVKAGVARQHRLNRRLAGRSDEGCAGVPPLIPCREAGLALGLRAVQHLAAMEPEPCLTGRGKHLRVGPEDAIAGGGSVHAGADGYGVFVIGREVEHGGPALFVQMRVALGRAPLVLFGVEGAVDGREPAFLSRAHARSADNQQIRGAGRCDVADADRLGAILRLFLILVVAQLPRSLRTELLGAKAARGVDVPVTASALGGTGSHIGEDCRLYCYHRARAGFRPAAGQCSGTRR